MPAPKEHPNLKNAGMGRTPVPDEQKVVNVNISLDPETLADLDAIATTKRKYKRSYIIRQCLKAIAGKPSDLTLDELIEIFRE